jgi:hypothetical protein
MIDKRSRYKTPEAARTAVTAKLRGQVRESPWQLGDLQRQYAYDQLVERLYRLDSAWVIKGATALLARKMSVRHTIDIDVYRPGAIAEAERQVRASAALDIGDWMRFEIGPPVTVQAAGAEAARVKVRALIGSKVWAAFQVDIVADGIMMTGEPDAVPPLTTIEIGDRERTPWRAYALVDHVADKVCAIVERHDGRPSTRFKDLIDLVAIAQHSSVRADLQMTALAKEAGRRGLSLPTRFDVPDRVLWSRGYRAEARRTVRLSAKDLDAALDVALPFVDPLLSESASGTWNPETRAWNR